MVDIMTKRDMLLLLDKLEDEKGVRISQVNVNSNKNMIQSAIDCLNCSDELLDKYLDVLATEYPATARTIAGNGNFKLHRFNRYYVYSTARMILAN